MERERLDEAERVGRQRKAPVEPGQTAMASHLLGMQASAGNRATAAAVQRLPVQRVIELDELGIETGPVSGGAGTAAVEGASAGAASAGPAGVAAGSEAATAGAAATGAAAGATGATETPAGGVNELGTVARVGTLIADTIVATSYTPGAGNIF
jgi:hypothetical protein